MGRVLFRWVFLSILLLQLYLLINEDDEHVACLNECMFSSAMYMMDYTSWYVLCLRFLSSALYACSCSWGYFPVCLVIVASSSVVWGSGTLQCGIRAKGCSMGLNVPWRYSDRAYVAAFGPQRAMKDQLAEASCPLPSRNQKNVPENFGWKILQVPNSSDH